MESLDPEIFEQVVQVLDPDGNIREQTAQMEAVARAFPNHPLMANLGEIARNGSDLLRTAALANQLLSPRGWGLANMPVPAMESALEVVATEPERADEILAAAWTESHVDRGISRMKVIYTRLELNEGLPFEVRAARWALVREAKRLHFSGAYAAAVPLVLANIDGLAADAAAGKLFFTARDSKRIDMLDPTRLTGMVCALTTLQALYTRGVNSTTTEPVLSRHGILHGRVLGYGTRVVSAKVLTLFDALADLLI